jgi:hypothetical protein
MLSTLPQILYFALKVNTIILDLEASQNGLRSRHRIQSPRKKVTLTGVLIISSKFVTSLNFLRHEEKTKKIKITQCQAFWLFLYPID